MLFSYKFRIPYIFTKIYHCGNCNSGAYSFDGMICYHGIVICNDCLLRSINEHGYNPSDESLCYDEWFYKYIRTDKNGELLKKWVD